MLDLEALLSDFIDELLHGVRLVEFDQAGAAVCGWIGFLGLFDRLLSDFAFNWCLGGFDVEEVEVGIFQMEFAHLGFAREIGDPFGVALADFQEVSRKCTGFGIALAEVGFEVASMAADRVAELRQTLEEFEHFAQLGGRECFAVGEVFQLYLVSTERDEDFVERGVIVHILFALLALDEIERRARDVDFALLHEFRHLAVEKGEKQSADVRAVHIGVGHDDDAAVAETGEVERALLVAGSNASADGSDERLDFGVLKHLVEAGFFDIDDFTFDRKDRLVAAVAALFGRTTGRVALDDIELGERWIALGAVGQLAGESAAG